MSINFTPQKGSSGLVTQGTTNGCLPAAITNFLRINTDLENVLVIFDSENDEFEPKEKRLTFNLHGLTADVDELRKTDKTTGEILECEIEPPFDEYGLEIDYISSFFNRVKDEFRISTFECFACETFQEFKESHENLSDNYLGSIVLYKKRCFGNKLVDHYIAIVREEKHWYKLDSNTQTVKFKVACFNNILTKGKEIVPIRYFQFFFSQLIKRLFFNK